MTAYHRPLTAKRTEYNGRMYPSRMQARRAMELDLLVRAGEVAWWLPEYTFRLGPDHTYRVDFLVAYHAGYGGKSILVHAEDVKAVKTRDQARHERMWKKYGPPFPLHVITPKGTEIIEREV